MRAGCSGGGALPWLLLLAGAEPSWGCEGKWAPTRLLRLRRPSAAEVRDRLEALLAEP